MDSLQIIENYLKSDGRWYGHCEGRAEMVFLEKGRRTVSCMACPGGYVSRIVMYAPEVDPADLQEFLAVRAGALGPVSEEEIRVATRHPWDLGIEGQVKEDVAIRQAYWTQNYRKTKADNPSRNALFLCRDCSELFVSPLSDGVHRHAGQANGGRR